MGDSDSIKASQVIHRLLQANRDGFDSAMPTPGAVERHIQALETDLTAARDENRALKALLEAIQSSTTWRLTRPLRAAIDAVRGPLRARVSESNAPAPTPASTSLSYANWIATEEIGRLDALALPGSGQHVVGRQTLGLVLLAAPGCDVDLALLASRCTPDYQVLVLDQEGTSSSQASDNPAIQMHPVLPRTAPASIVRLATERLDTDMICFLDARDRLAPLALKLVAIATAQQPHLDIVFSDEDWLDDSGHRTAPFFKPGWDQELQLGRDLIGPYAFYRTALVRAATISDGASWRQDLANQIAAATQPDRIHHIPAVLCHRRVPPPDHTGVTAAQLRRSGVTAAVAVVASHPEWARVSYGLPTVPPLVSIIVPTRDHAELLSVCAAGVLDETDYARLELLIVDNGTTDPAAMALVERLAANPRVQVLRHPGAFNWSALNNAAAAVAKGDVLVLLNNDIAVLQPDWLSVIVAHALQPGVGAAGAKLLYPDGRVQHAGLTTDRTGLPRHLLRYASTDDDKEGDFGARELLGLARRVWGVTGACLAIRRSVFLEVGGLNEALPVAYNDVDLCLRLSARGYHIVWTPWSLLQHRELASRPPDHTEGRRAQAREELDRLLRDWGPLARHDPFVNANLELQGDNLCLRRRPGQRA